MNPDRARRAAKSSWFLAATLAGAAALALVVYAASTSLPYLAASPTLDSTFGGLNQCLLDALKERPVGYAVAPDGNAAVAYTGARVAICTRGADAGATSRVLEHPGATSAAFDLRSALWIGDANGLWRLAESGLELAGDFAPLALAGHAMGVAGIDPTGRLLSLSAGGEALGYAQLQGPATGAQLSANLDGSLLAVVSGGGLFVYRASNLAPVRAESPCAVEYLWWGREPARALLACGPEASWALSLQVETGEKEEAGRRDRRRSVLVPRLGAYVHGCDGLPCLAPDPW